ncbi:hypothetical protein JXA47_09185 [Candidatus Sumerlaeota bacterium]|nr:hypothetical protein [Candidatus Sumerlaeota bacterium]
MALLVMGDIRASQGELRRARDVLLPVASGAVAASSEARYQAMWLMARVYHALDWRRTAYRAYREIETVCPTLRDLTLCQLEQIGLLMELARSGSGRLVECRLASDIFIEEHSSLASEDSQVRQRCATAALMAAESWFWEGQCERCIEETSRVAVLYEDITREWAVAMTFKGFALARLGRHLEAITVFHEVCDHPWNSETDDFPNYHQQAIAASALVRSLEATGQSEAAVNWRNTILERWPDSRTARQLMTNALEGVR